MALKDEEPLVRFFAAEALGKIGSEALPAMPELTKALKDKEAAVQVSAAPKRPNHCRNSGSM